MNALANTDKTTPSVAVTSLVDEHGLWAVLAALVTTALRPRREVVRLDDLTPHLRRDMGLPPIDQPRTYWELR